MKRASKSSRGARVRLADVARGAGVSLMTASYAMRNNPKISAATRDRVQRAARKLGYVPDPEIGRLMHLLRARNMPSFQSTIGFLRFTHARQKGADHRYTLDVIEGARRRATALGYAVDALRVDLDTLSPSRLTSMLTTRGIRGVLIPPLASVEDCASALDWSQFAIVAATYSAQNMIVNRVVPHHLNNVMAAIGHLRRAGLRRLGLVLTADLLQRANSAYEAAVTLFQARGEIPPIPALNLDPSNPDRMAGAVDHWVDMHRPDAILTVENAVPVLKRALGRRFGSSTHLCLLDHPGSGPLSGVHQEPMIIGETAIELLAGQLQRGEFGPREHPRVTMIEGTWHRGTLP